MTTCSKTSFFDSKWINFNHLCCLYLAYKTCAEAATHPPTHSQKAIYCCLVSVSHCKLFQQAQTNSKSLIIPVNWLRTCCLTYNQPCMLVAGLLLLLLGNAIFVKFFSIHSKNYLRSAKRVSARVSAHELLCDI